MITMRILFITLLSLGILSVTRDKKEEHKIIHEGREYFYETQEGRLNGRYISYYKNGKIKAEGEFSNNYRSGKWTIWDSSGNVMTIRKYKNPFEFQILVPRRKENKVIKLLNVPQYQITYNSEGLIKLFYVHERSVVWSNRCWRIMYPENNELIFQNDALFLKLAAAINNKELKMFSGNDDQFRSLVQNPFIDTSAYDVVAYKFKEDSFFDNERLVSETRIIGICPVVVPKNKRDPIDLCWIYFPQCRKFLTQSIQNRKGIPKHIKTLDDLFFFHYFASKIEKTGNIFDKVNTEIKMAELQLIEKEHELWLNFAGMKTD